MAQLDSKTTMLDVRSESWPPGREQGLPLCSTVNPLGRIRGQKRNHFGLHETCYPAKGFLGLGGFGFLCPLTLLEAAMEPNSLGPLKNKVELTESSNLSGADGA